MTTTPLEKPRFAAAINLAEVFKLLAWLTLALGAVGVVATLSSSDDFNDESANLAGAVAVGATAVVTAAVFAFFSFVLEILAAIYEQAWHIRFPEEDDGEDDET